MTRAFYIVTLLLAGCVRQMDVGSWNLAAKACVEHGGVLKVTVDAAYSATYSKCMDGAVVRADK